MSRIIYIPRGEVKLWGWFWRLFSYDVSYLRRLYSIYSKCKKANEARKQRRNENLDKVVDLAKRKKVNNQDIRDLLHIGKSTTAEYLSTLVKSGKLKV